MLSSPIRGVAIAFAAILAACAPGRYRPTDPAAGGVTLSVRNDSDEDMRIYAVNASGARTRLGTVMRTSRGDLRIPAYVLRSWDVQLLAAPIGGGAARSFSCPLKIQAGAALRLSLDRNPVLWSCRKA